MGLQEMYLQQVDQTCYPFTPNSLEIKMDTQPVYESHVGKGSRQGFVWLRGDLGEGRMALFFIYVHCFPKHRCVWCQEFNYGPAVSQHTLLVSKDTLQRQSLSNLLAISSGACASISHHVLILLSLDLSFFFFSPNKTESFNCIPEES